MQYLPIYPEKSWGQTVLTPMQQISYQWDWWENLPLTYWTIDSSINLYNQVGGGIPGIYPMVVGWVSTPFMMLADALWTIWNTTYNWYKRLYNYWANAYNNLADTYNNWAMQRANPQTSLTWRKLPSTMVVPQAPTVVQTEIPQPEKYLYWNGKIQAKIVEPPVYQYSTGAPTFTTIWQRGKGWTSGQLNRLQNLYNRTKNYGTL